MAAAHRADGLQAVRFPRAEDLALLMDMRPALKGADAQSRGSARPGASVQIDLDALPVPQAEAASVPAALPGHADSLSARTAADDAANGDRFFVPLPPGTDVVPVDEHALLFEPAPAHPGRLRLAAELQAARGVAERARIVSGLMGLMGFSSLTYALTERHENAPPTVAMLKNYVTPRFLQRYCDERLFTVDPRLPAVFATGMPLVWDLASLARGQARMEPALRALLQTMDEHGLRSGVMFSLGAGKGTSHAIVSLSSPHAGREWISDSVLGQSILFGMALHQVWRAPLQTFARNTRACSEEAPLTVMQSRVLTCLASGMSDKEIAIKLHTTAHNVDYHLRLIRRRYGATNRAQLAYIAGRLNLI